MSTWNAEMSGASVPTHSAPTPPQVGYASRDGSFRPPMILAALVGMILYAVTLGGTWIYDDLYHLFNDWRALQPEPGSDCMRPIIEEPRLWHYYITESYNDAIDNLYRPVTSLSFAVQAAIFGRSDRVAWAWHLVNVLLYGIVCAQVALLAGRMALVGSHVDSVGSDQYRRAINGASWMALCAGLLFATHPVHVEVVAGIVGRAELFCAVGFLGALLVLTRPLTPARILAFVVLMFLSIGGKEQGLVLPAVALAWYLSRRRMGLASLTRRTPTANEARPAEMLDDAPESLAYEPVTRPSSDDLSKALIAAVALPLAAYLIIREQVLKLSMAWPVSLLDPTIQTMRDAAGLDRLLMPVALTGRYFALLLWPQQLAIDYGSVVIEPPQRMDDPFLWLGLVAIAIFIAALVHAWRARWAAGLTMLAGFAFSYGLVCNFAIIGTIFGERLLFLPSAFFIIYLVLLTFRLFPGHGSARFIIALAAAASILGAARSFTYAQRWNDRLAFYAYQSQVQPRSLRIWLLLGEEQRQVAEKLRARGQHAAAEAMLAEAAESARISTEVKPDYWSNWILRSRVAMDRGHLEEALEYAQRAVNVRTSVTTTGHRAAVMRMIAQRDAQRVQSTQPSRQSSTAPAAPR